MSSEHPPSAGPRSSALRWLVWLAFLVVWSRALLIPSPERFLPSTELQPYSFEIAKVLHVSMYALLAVLSGWLRVPRRRRWLLLAVMCAHAALTEYLQQFVRDRHPSLRDVGLDVLGIALGVLGTWRWWWKEDTKL